MDLMSTTIDQKRRTKLQIGRIFKEKQRHSIIKLTFDLNLQRSNDALGIFQDGQGYKYVKALKASAK